MYTCWVPFSRISSSSLSTFSLWVYFDVDRIEQGTFIYFIFSKRNSKWSWRKLWLYTLDGQDTNSIYLFFRVVLFTLKTGEREKKSGGREGGGLADAVGDCADDQLNTGRVNGSLVRVENRRGCARAVRQKKMDIKGTQRAEGRSVGYVRVTTSEATRS